MKSKKFAIAILMLVVPCTSSRGADKDIIDTADLPTENERLTIVTGWPEKGNSHRTVVIALPEQ